MSFTLCHELFLRKAEDIKRTYPVVLHFKIIKVHLNISFAPISAR